MILSCAEYAKKHDLLHLDGWKRLEHIAKNQKQLTRAINQSKIRQVRRSAVYQFGFLIPIDYKQAQQLDEQNGNSKWYDAESIWFVPSCGSELWFQVTCSVLNASRRQVRFGNTKR